MDRKKGSKVKIWKQDPSVEPIGIRSVYIHTPVEDGPKDSEIVIISELSAIANSKGDFLYNPDENPKEFDAVHTFTVVRQVLTMYKRALLRTKIRNDLSWSWQWGANLPIKVYPRAGEEDNAEYNRDRKSLRFFYFHPGNNEALPLVYTCRSFDLVAHETGHAILDALRPGYENSSDPETNGLKEYFGDFTAILTMLSQMDQCEAIIAESKGNLHNESFFTAFAEQYGKVKYGRSTGLRNCDNDLKLSEVENKEDAHELSQVFTGAVYDILVDIFEDYHKPDLYDPAETLFRIGKHMTDLIILSIVHGPTNDATFKNIAEQMIKEEPENNWKAIIKRRFTERGVLS